MSEKSKKDQNGESRSTFAAETEGANGLAEDLRRIEEIRLRAYEIYKERGGQPGHDVDDWCQAEREIESRSDGHPDFITSAHRNDA
jgi:hypothetical protein